MRSESFFRTMLGNGLLWLQITPVDKLVAAVRGLLSASEGGGSER